MRIGEPAWKHGISEEDIWHAIRNGIIIVALGEGFTLSIGPALDGRLLEIGFLDYYGDDPVAIHAMELREKFYAYLERGND